MSDGIDSRSGNGLPQTIRGTEWRGRFRVTEDSTESGSLGPGKLVADRYLVMRELGRGGMGKVFLAEDRVTTIVSRRQVVLKILNPAARGGDDLRRQFENEANLLASLSNDNIAGCYGAFMLSDGMPVLVMEYVEGESLDEYLRNHGGRLDEDSCRELLIPIAGALDYAHESGVFHLDVKPQNIVVRKTRRNGAATCLLDFGIAVGSVPSSSSGTYGTRQYMAPESGEKPSAAMDIYSLAVTAYECLMGEVPYPDGWRMNRSVRPIDNETPFTCAVMRGLSELPEDRPVNCMELIDPDLDEIGRKTGPEKLRQRRRRFPPPPVERLRVSRRHTANGALKVEWDWPDDLETCMWAIVRGPVSRMEDVPEEDRRWISRKAYHDYGGVSVPGQVDGDETRSVVVFGVYVLVSANRTFACKEPKLVDLAEKTISYRLENVARGWRRILHKKPVLAIRSSYGDIPEVEVWAEGPRGKRRLMTVPAQQGQSELKIDWKFELREHEMVRLRMPMGANAQVRFVHPFVSEMKIKGGFL